MARALKITNTEAYNSQIHDRYTSPNQINSAYIGGTGGNTSQTGRQIQPIVFCVGGTQGTGSIITQKGRKEFFVTDGTLAKQCALINGANTVITSTTGLTANTMVIIADVSAISAANIAAANVAGGATVGFVTYANTAITGFQNPAVGSSILGFSGNAAAAVVVAVNATANNGTLCNVSVSLLGNVASQTAVAVTNSFYVQRISNKFVHDWLNVKYRYHLATADTTFVKVAYA